MNIFVWINFCFSNHSPSEKLFFPIRFTARQHAAVRSRSPCSHGLQTKKLPTLADGEKNSRSEKNSERELSAAPACCV